MLLPRLQEGSHGFTEWISTVRGCIPCVKPFSRPSEFSRSDPLTSSHKLTKDNSGSSLAKFASPGDNRKDDNPKLPSAIPLSLDCSLQQYLLARANLFFAMFLQWNDRLICRRKALTLGCEMERELRWHWAALGCPTHVSVLST